jgi:hypothetical protein
MSGYAYACEHGCDETVAALIQVGFFAPVSSWQQCRLGCCGIAMMAAKSLAINTQQVLLLVISLPAPGMRSGSK